MYNPRNSIKTSRNFIAAVINKNKDKLKDTKWLNFGCGAYCKNVYTLLGGYHYDPYLVKVNSVYEFNDLSKIPCNKFDYVVCANVLNVLQNRDLIKVIKQLYSIDTDNIIISIYEGDKTNNKKTTSHGTFQRNEKTVNYVNKIQDIFIDYSISMKGNEIYITRNM
ncbi:hypothetical protein [Vibrio phage S4-7]|nr:hypothetical protein [Vibrio phage S4-7]